MMNIHYFQRYHNKENVVTANTMLLLSRLYNYSSDKFYRLLKTYFFGESFEPEISFALQERSDESVPDAAILQPSFKIIVETKLHNQFSLDQLEHHMGSFRDERYCVLLTLDPKPMQEKMLEKVEEMIAQHNLSSGKTLISHKNMTFEMLIDAVQEELDERDYEMKDILEDYRAFCTSEQLLPDDWKWMRVRLAGTTFEWNMRHGVYYDSIEHGFSGHAYIGLYSQKSVRAIGKISRIVTYEMRNGREIIHCELPQDDDVPLEVRNVIHASIEDGKRYGYDLNNTRFFFVERFYQTDFQKITPKAPMGARIFDLSKILGTEVLPDTERIAEQLKSKTWQ